MHAIDETAARRRGGVVYHRSTRVIARKDLSAPDSLVDLRAGGRYLAFRGLLFLAMLCILVASISIEVVDGKGRCWPIYLTHQGALIETVYLGPGLLHHGQGLSL